jgi:hypothetical protein
MFGRKKKQQAQAQAQAWQAVQSTPVSAAPAGPQATTQFIPGLGTVQTTNEVIDASQVPGLKEAILATLQQHGIQVPHTQVFAGAGMPGPMLDQPAPAIAQTTPSAREQAGQKAERLRHLEMLRDGGLITPEELDTLRQKLQPE